MLSLLNPLSVFVALPMMPPLKLNMQISNPLSCICKLLSPSLKSSPPSLVSCPMLPSASPGQPANVVVKLLLLSACLVIPSSRNIMPKISVVKLFTLALLELPCCKLAFAKLAKLLFVFGARLSIWKKNLSSSLALLPALLFMASKLVLLVMVPFVLFAVLWLRPFGVFSVAFVPSMPCCCFSPKAT